MIFRNRKDAGQKLAAHLLRFRNARPIVLALVRGGLPVGFEVAAALEAPLDIVLVRKIGAPGNPELAVGAIVDGTTPEIVINRDITGALGISEDYLGKMADRELTEIERRRVLYLGERTRPSVKSRTVIVVDDGIATGATMRAALHALRRQEPERLVLAVPVAAADTIETLREDADEIICLSAPESLGAIGYYYEDFRQVSDERVIELLDRAASVAEPAPPPGTGPS